MYVCVSERETDRDYATWSVLSILNLKFYTCDQICEIKSVYIKQITKFDWSKKRLLECQSGG